MQKEEKKKQEMQYPVPVSGGSFIVAWRAKDKHILVIGGGNVATGRVFNALEADAIVTVISPKIDDELYYRYKNSQINWIQSEFKPSFLDELQVDLVLSTINDHEKSKEIVELCRHRKLPVNAADINDLCDFWFMSMHRDGPLQIAVSTNSKAPRLANRIRRKIAAAMPIGAGKAIENIGELREKIKAGNPGIQNVGRRMGWMKEFCDYWPIEEIAKIGSDDIDRIFTSYLDQKSAGSVPLNGVKVEEGQAEERYQVDNESQVETKPASDVPEEKPEDQTTKDKEVLEESTSSLSSSSVGQVYCRSRFSPKNATAGESAKVSGCLYLVGAGIGKPELMTIQAKEVLETADVILSDKLVSKEILDMISDIQKVRNSEKKLEIFIARKFTGMADAAQNELNIKGLEALEQGKVVVRLKQGDPFLYGRGGEEVLFYEEHGYKCRVIPGISSALSGPLLSRISVTHRGVADQVLILSGNDRNRSLPKVPEYLQSRTLVILMCIKRLNDIVQLLLSSGYPAELPIAIVERAGSEDQRTLRGTLSNIVSILERLGSNPPGLIVVGHVVNVLQSTKPFEISDINSIVRENSQNVEECGEMIAA